MKDGTLPFDPQRIAEGILEGVQNSSFGRPSQPGQFRKKIALSTLQRLVSDARATSGAPKNRGNLT
jgi:hypothetical protein